MTVPDTHSDGQTDFLLLQSGKRQREEPLASDDLLAHFHLARLYEFSQKSLVPVNYLKGIAGDTSLRRCPGGELAPLADQLPSLTKPDFKQFTPDVLRDAFQLTPGVYALSEEDAGTVLVSEPQAPASQPSTISSGNGKKRKDKRVKKEKKGKKEKKSEKDVPGALKRRRSQEV